jgi:hypothetical protein
MKKFFDIKEKTYKFEIADLTSIITVLNVAFVLLGFWWAPFFGVANCILGLIINIKNHLHINMYVLQIALLVLNIYFLTL